MVMSFTATITSLGQTHDAWVKMCNIKQLCDDPTQTCKTLGDGFSGSGIISDMKNCQVACSTSNNVQIPGSGGNNSGVTMTVNVVAAILSFVAAVMYAFM